ncbi:MAG: phenylalanine--tRNA ligase subunit alpha, partial [Candidatus Baumannia cicadellinicola]|nr:phenylalanine--tRNA ligase subunit alpha [Candidatus Baumannia cicadellinicola]
GYFNQQVLYLRHQTPDKQPQIGALFNKAKQEVKQAILDRKQAIKLIKIKTRLATESVDISLPGRRLNNGALHPLSQTVLCLEKFFSQLGFSIEHGPEIEHSYYNFDALNIPIHHPSRTDQDTFWINSTQLLRTQTSGIQIRIMQSYQPPIRIITSGRVYRRDYDQTHTPMFHQMEGLMIDNSITFAHLKNTIHELLHYFFEDTVKVRFRPSYFPFTQPSAEVDIMSKNKCWLEVLGCGMVHPVILRNVGIDPDIYSGFAFGIGIERMAMLRYSIVDLRAFFDNDLRFLKQFK